MALFSSNKTEKMITIIKTSLSAKGGLEKAFQAILEGFLRKGEEVTLLSRSKISITDRKISSHKIPTISWPKTFRLLTFNSYVKSYLKKNPTHIVFGMDRTTEQTHMRAGNGVHRAFLEKSELLDKHPTFHPYHSTILHLEKRGFENENLKKIFVNSHMVKEEIIHYYRVNPAKIEVIHNGVKWKEKEEVFTAWPHNREQILQRLSLPRNRFHFLFIGNGFSRKGLSPLLKGLSLLPRKKFTLSIVGNDHHLSMFRALAKQLGLEDNIFFFGFQSDVTPFYQMADAMVIPSFYDPFANVTVEGLAMGLPVLSSKNNGGSEILTKENGRVIENLFCEEEMAYHLKKLMEKPKNWENSLLIRNSVCSLEEEKQIDTLVNSTLAY